MAKSKSKSSKRRHARAAGAKTARAAKRRMVQERALEAEAARRLEKLLSDAAPVERSAELILERLEARPVSAGITRLGGFEVEVNSRERFERLLEIFRELGAEPKISRKLILDPTEDLPALRRGPLFPFAASRESNAAWCEHWPDTSLPALGGRTPRQAARRERDQPSLKALLRELEHGVDLMARGALEVPGIGGLRRTLQMPAEAWMA